MNRRYFLFGSLASTFPSHAAARRKILIVLVDGFGPEYLERSEMPNLKRMGREGGIKIGKTVIPSVTNVNNASLVTGSFPKDHGITTNYQFDRATGKSFEMESAAIREKGQSDRATDELRRRRNRKSKKQRARLERAPA